MKFVKNALQAMILLLIAAVATQISANGDRVQCVRGLTKIHNMLCYGSKVVPFDLDIPPEVPERGDSVMATLKLRERFAYRSLRTKLERQRSQRLIEACCIQSCPMSDLLEHC